jgi:hypothetical protein
MLAIRSRISSGLGDGELTRASPSRSQSPRRSSTQLARDPFREPAWAIIGGAKETLAGVGLIYAFEPFIADEIARGRLRVVLEPFTAAVPGLFLYFPSRARVELRSRPRSGPSSASRVRWRGSRTERRNDREGTHFAR